MKQRKISKIVWPSAAAAVLFVGLVACSSGAQAQKTSFDPLVQDMAMRLQTAYPVALSKWDSGKLVYDAAREAQVIANVEAAAPEYKLTTEDAASIFRDQIEANKMLQYALLDDWRHAKEAPAAPHQPLPAIRKELDRLQVTIMHELHEIDALRDKQDCQTQVAKSVERVAGEKRFGFDVQHRSALNRAVANVCRR